jgi:hypothetical protein
MKRDELPVRGVPGRVVLGVVGNAVDTRWDAARAVAASAEGTTERERVHAVTTRYVRQLAAVGAAAGGTAAVPGVGTIAALGAATAEVGVFAHRAAEMILAIGAAHGHEGADGEERRAWVLAVLTFGESAAAELGAVSAALASEAAAGAARDGSSWFESVNRYLGRKLLARWGARRGVRWLGRLLPFGIGAAFGAGTNYAIARRLAHHADRFFANLPRREGMPELARSTPAIEVAAT